MALIVANWKMHGSKAFAETFIEHLKQASFPKVQVVLCPPYPYLECVHRLCQGTPFQVGAQTLHTHLSGAYTGEVSAAMVKDMGCTHVILGHSERRTLFGESDEVVAQKVRVALSVGLIPIICVGETLAEREQGQTIQRIYAQLQVALSLQDEGEILIAYEPVWAIGTGRTPKFDEIATVHAALKKHYSSPLLYGGSVKADNAKEILALPHVEGVLVGGASLEAAQFMAIAQARVP